MSSPELQRRSRLFVHSRVQGWLLLRILVYLACAAVFVTISLLLWQLAVRGPARWNHNHLRDIWEQYAPVFISVGVLVPLFLYDMLRFSHRFMGPLHRLHRSLEALGRGESVRPIRFRKGDLLHEMADAFNQVARRLEQLEAGGESSRETRAPENSPPRPAEEPSDAAAAEQGVPQETLAS